MHSSVNTLINSRLPQGIHPRIFVRMTIGQRLNEAMHKMGFQSQSELARASGVTQPTINRILKEVGGERGPSPETLVKLADACNVSVEWLMTGKAFTAASLYGARPVVTELDAPSNVVRIRKLEQVALRAGITGWATDEMHLDGDGYTIDQAWMDRHGFHPADLVAVSVKGDSMETAISDGDIVVLNTADRRPVEGKIFAVNHHGEPVIKRLKRDRARGVWLLVSDNTDQQKYKPDICQGDDCLFVGRVVRIDKDLA